MKFRREFQSETVRGLIFRRTLTGYKLDPERVRSLTATIWDGKIQDKQEVISVVNRLMQDNETFGEISNRVGIIAISIVTPICAGMTYGLHSCIPRTRGGDGTRYIGFPPEFFYPGNGINDVIGREFMHNEQIFSMVVGASAPIVLYGAFKLARLIRKGIFDPFFNMFYLGRLDKIFVKQLGRIRQTAASNKTMD